MTTIYQVSEDDLMFEGVRIKLTKEQKELIEKERNKRRQCRGSFAKMLKYFGFKPISDFPGAFEHPKKGWYAEVIKGNCYDYVWMVGIGLKDGGFPGGSTYAEPKEIEDEILSLDQK